MIQKGQKVRKGMKIVIDIDDDVYKRALVYKNIQLASNRANDLSELTTAVANGTPLPKGHGRLFILDEKVAKKYLTKFSFSLQDWISEVGISEATLKIIEADKDGE